jgi:hypothetical protein
MSIPSLLFCLICFSAYKLGVYNERHPGDLWKRMKLVWAWMSK